MGFFKKLKKKLKKPLALKKKLSLSANLTSKKSLAKISTLHAKSHKFSLSHQLGKAVGGKKGERVASQVGTGVADIFTFGGASLAKGLAARKSGRDFDTGKKIGVVGHGQFISEPTAAAAGFDFDRALGAADRVLDVIGGGQASSAGGEFELPPAGPDQVDENGERPPLMPFVLIGVGLLAAAFLLGRR